MRLLSHSYAMKNEHGFSLLELMYIVIIGSILLGATVLILRPSDLRARARDENRLSDISSLERAFGEYFLSNESYPGDADYLYVSTSLPEGAISPLFNVQSGWIKTNMSSYLTKLPVDPINDATYNYSYMQSGSTFEINAVMEYLTEYSQNDGGDDSNVYEVGNDLTII